jgi:hypothetical protein
MENDKITNKHPGGRPLKFKNEKELQKKIDAWLKSCKKEKRPLTITGLALALGTGRNVLIDYENREEFSNTIKRAKLLCENYAEESLFLGKNVAGAIFNLKNNYGWKEKQEIEHNGGVFINLDK